MPPRASHLTRRPAPPRADPGAAACGARGLHPGLAGAALGSAPPHRPGETRGPRPPPGAPAGQPPPRPCPASRTGERLPREEGELPRPLPAPLSRVAIACSATRTPTSPAPRLGSPSPPSPGIGAAPGTPPDPPSPAGAPRAAPGGAGRRKPYLGVPRVASRSPAQRGGSCARAAAAGDLEAAEGTREREPRGF